MVLSMSRRQNNKELKRLIEEWDQILLATGFKDIEKTVNGMRVLSQFSSNAYRHADKEVIESKIEYFSKISERVFSFTFGNEVDKSVMEMYSVGSKIKHIVDELSRKGLEINRNTIRFIIRRHEHWWGIRVWTNKKMNLRQKA